MCLYPKCFHIYTVIGQFQYIKLGKLGIREENQIWSTISSDEGCAIVISNPVSLYLCSDLNNFSNWEKKKGVFWLVFYITKFHA